jgi:hypothetical protein
MALKLAVSFKGQPAEYWTIIGRAWDKVANKTTCVLGLYFSRESREQGINNYLDRRGFTFQFDRSTIQCYEQIKLPILNDEGVNENPFVDAEDLL